MSPAIDERPTASVSAIANTAATRSSGCHTAREPMKSPRTNTTSTSAASWWSSMATSMRLARSGDLAECHGTRRHQPGGDATDRGFDGAGEHVVGTHGEGHRPARRASPWPRRGWCRRRRRRSPHRRSSRPSPPRRGASRCRCQWSRASTISIETPLASASPSTARSTRWRVSSRITQARRAALDGAVCQRDGSMRSCRRRRPSPHWRPGDGRPCPPMGSR